MVRFLGKSAVSIQIYKKNIVYVDVCRWDFFVVFANYKKHNELWQQWSLNHLTLRQSYIGSYTMWYTNTYN